MSENPYLLSIVVPIYNESEGLLTFHKSLIDIVRSLAKDKYEVIYCDDGSTDDTAKIISRLNNKNPKVKLLKFTKNFGKEIAITAGFHKAKGQAIISIDSDGQHPVELIPTFVERWRGGSKVVIGLRTSNRGEGLVKRWGSKLFYKLLNGMTGMKLVPGGTDFRLIDCSVQADFKLMTERNRITRGLIDWLGYHRDYVEFVANNRIAGEAGYSFRKLLKLAIDSFISLSISPLYITAYIGAFILPTSTLLGLFMIANFLFGDPLKVHATASSYLVVLILFLVGILLVSQGIIGLYLSHIHTETQNRPLYIVDQEISSSFK